MKFKTKNIFNNRKTTFSVDFNICALMNKNPQGNYESPLCQGCYAARLINVYPGVKAKLETISGNYPNVSDFVDDIKKIAGTGLRFIRFYSLGDYNTAAEIAYIHTAASILPVEIFSKTLHQFHRHDMPLLMSKPNIHLSLSLNKNYSDAYIETLWDFLKNNHLLKNVQLNYTFFSDEPYAWKKYISVYHTCKKDKLALKTFFGKFRVCCAKDGAGKEITTKNSGNHTGSCLKCALCKLPSSNEQGQILTPKLMESLYG